MTEKSSPGSESELRHCFTYDMQRARRLDESKFRQSVVAPEPRAAVLSATQFPTFAVDENEGVGLQQAWPIDDDACPPHRISKLEQEVRELSQTCMKLSFLLSNQVASEERLMDLHKACNSQLAVQEQINEKVRSLHSDVLALRSAQAVFEELPKQTRDVSNQVVSCQTKLCEPARAQLYNQGLKERLEAQGRAIERLEERITRIESSQINKAPQPLV